jgi:ribonuclease D
MVGLDLETTGLRWWQDRIRVISITTEDGKTYLVDASKVDITPLFPALKDTKIIAHNAKFDLLFLKRAGFEPGECACTMILSQIFWAGKLKPGTNKNFDHDLASVVKRALDIDLIKSHQKDDWSGELTPEMLDYAARDSMSLVKLYKELTRRIVEAS